MRKSLGLMKSLVMAGTVLLGSQSSLFAQGGGGGSGGGGGGGGGNNASASSIGSSLGTLSLGSSSSTGGSSSSSTTLLGVTSGGKYGTTSFLGGGYANPLSIGQPLASSSASSTATTLGVTNPVAFGTAVYNVTPTTITVGTSSSSTRGSAGGTGTASISTTQLTPGGYAGRLPTFYTIETNFDPPPLAPPAVFRTNVQTMLNTSERFTYPGSLSIAFDDKGVIVLRGTVKDSFEAKIIENMIRFERGVGDIRNELVLTKDGNR